MAYLEELLPEFRKGAKIRKNIWDKSCYFCFENENIWNEDDKLAYFDGNDLLSDTWEFYQEPIDWQYIIDNKCLCRFWNGDDIKKGVIDYLVTVSNESYELYENTSGCRWSHCRPVRRDEVTFYEDERNED